MLVGMVHDKAEKGEAHWDAGAGDEAGRRAHSNRKAECLGQAVGECANCPWKSLLTPISQWTRKQGHQLGAHCGARGEQAQEETAQGPANPVCMVWGLYPTSSDEHVH